ncbi:MAG: molybdenum cofactor biosynthesis protein MoaE [Candidatus Thermoplasmatota archaeon]|nr:molybdenum cofactor biosynthesis protein MoaE [Candidatus Thermoplasmatota archaeon]
MNLKVAEEPIDTGRALASLKADTGGAVVTFSGIVRANEGGRILKGLQYDCYMDMAKKLFQEAGEYVVHRFSLLDLVAIHRIGFVAPGETSLFVAVSALHRSEAFNGCSEFVEQIKKKVPIWKKDIFAEGGESWH